MVKELGVPWPFTPFSTSGFWGRGGELMTEAPVVRTAYCLPVCHNARVRA